MNNNVSQRKRDVSYIMNCLKKYNVNTFITIPCAKSERTILIIIVKDSVLVLKKVKDIRNDILNYNDNLILDWAVMSKDLLEIKFKYAIV